MCKCGNNPLSYGQACAFSASSAPSGPVRTGTFLPILPPAEGASEGRANLVFGSCLALFIPLLCLPFAQQSSSRKQA